MRIMHANLEVGPRYLNKTSRIENNKTWEKASVA